MTPTALLEALSTQGVTLVAEGNNIRVTPSDRLTPEALNLLREHKQDLLVILASSHPGDTVTLNGHPHRVAACAIGFPDGSGYTMPHSGQ